MPLLELFNVAKTEDSAGVRSDNVAKTTDIFFLRSMILRPFQKIAQRCTFKGSKE